MRNSLTRIIILLSLAMHGGYPICAQTIFTPWGTVNGMRLEVGLVEFEAGLRVVHPDWGGFSAAVKYLQKPHYSRDGDHQTVVSAIEGMKFTEVLKDTAPGEATLKVALEAMKPIEMAGVYLCLDLPAHEFAGGSVEVWEGEKSAHTELATNPSEGKDDYLQAPGRQVRITGKHQQLDLSFTNILEVRVRRDGSDRPTDLNDPKINQVFTASPSHSNPNYQVYIKLMSGPASEGDRTSAQFTVRAKAVPDSDPALLEVDFTRPGLPFDGIGGNFRLQFPKTDPAVIGYNLDQLRVAWGRVEMPWADWEPDEKSPALERARAGQVNPRAREAMEMACILAQKKMPVIVSAWSPPRWARAAEPQPSGLRGTALNVEKMPRIRSSLADYLFFLKERYGVEAALFSFNEPETGVEVRQTAEEHADFVKEMGRELARRSLATRMLLGDTAHGTPAALDYLTPSLSDPSVMAQVGAVGFHTWRGCTADVLRRWSETARRARVPLLVTESGPDAHLHEYPSVRLEPWFQLQEIDLYLRICAFSQPATIMEWQLTTDYSVLAGGGVYGEGGPLRPTQRFWNLKQLGMTPAGAPSLPISCNKREITCAAFGSRLTQSVAVHLVNNGGRRRAMLSGLPESIQELRVFVTDERRGMTQDKPILVEAGSATLDLPAASYLTLLGN